MQPEGWTLDGLLQPEGWTLTYVLHQIFPQMTIVRSLLLGLIFLHGIHVSADDSIRLYRDAFGVPHVFANSREEAYFGAGYAVAEDLKWGLSQLALKAEGRQAEFLGRQGDLLNEDVFSRHFHFYKDALEKFALLSPPTQAAFRAYAAGIAARYAEMPDRPDWAIDVTPEHLAASFLQANFYQSAFQAQDHELKEMGLRLPMPYIGSNAFALGPSRMLDGSTVHFAGPQTPFGDSQPEIHLEWPGGRVAGYGYGLFVDPGMGLNHAWGATANWPDTSDSWRLRLDPDREGYYWDPLSNGGEGGWEPMSLMVFSVKVLGEPPREYRRWETRLGPVVWIDQKMRDRKVEEEFAYVWRPSTWGRIEYIDAVMKKQWAASLREAMSAADPPEVASGNWVMADRNGDIGFLYNGRIPGRADGAEHTKVMNASVSNGWESWFYALSGVRALPAALNPASGAIVSSNEAPWHVTLSGEIPARQQWPAYVVPAEGWGSSKTVRGERLRELLGQPDKRLTSEQAAALPFDVALPKVVRFIAACRSAFDSTPNRPSLSEKALEAHQLLMEWDGRATADSPGMTLAFFMVREMRPWQDPAEAANADLEGSVGDGREYAAAVEAVATRLQSAYGRVSVPWGEIHGMTVTGQWVPLGGGTDFLPAVFQAHAGDDRTVDRLGGYGRIRCADGSVHLAFTWFGANGLTRRFSVSPLGHHSPAVHPKSPHCTDQTALYAAGKFKPFWLTEADVLANLTPNEGQPGYEFKAKKALKMPVAATQPSGAAEPPAASMPNP